MKSKNRLIKKGRLITQAHHKPALHVKKQPFLHHTSPLYFKKKA